MGRITRIQRNARRLLTTVRRAHNSSAQLLRLWITRLHHFIKIFLKVPHVIRNKTKRMVQCEPLDIGGILGKIAALAVEFGENWFDLHPESLLCRGRCARYAIASDDEEVTGNWIWQA